MPTIVVADIPVEEFALRESLQAISDLAVESQRVVEKDEDLVMPLIWVRGANGETVQTTLSDDSSVSSASRIASYKNESLYKMEWKRDVELAVQMITEDEATILDLYGTSDGWRLRSMFPDRDTLARTVEFCENHGLGFDIRRVREMNMVPSGRWGLTDEQYEALRVAWDAGYFGVPREADLGDIADRLDISHQALSERLRRGHTNLIKETIGVGAPDKT
ncbi:DNA-binding protein [Halobacteriales archaeon QS_9_68_42]|nr:MAG: DNA-binding protein [Halobacteriales archaeon QS_9_68_42]